MVMPGRYKAHSFGAIAPTFSRESFAFQAPAIGIVFGIVDSRLVEVNPLVFLELR
jgi:hypothetical protein